MKVFETAFPAEILHAHAMPYGGCSGVGSNFCLSCSFHFAAALLWVGWRSLNESTAVLTTWNPPVSSTAVVMARDLDRQNEQRVKRKHRSLYRALSPPPQHTMRFTILMQCGWIRVCVSTRREICIAHRRHPVPPARRRRRQPASAGRSCHGHCPHLCATPLVVTPYRGPKGGGGEGGGWGVSEHRGLAGGVLG